MSFRPTARFGLVLLAACATAGGAAAQGWSGFLRGKGHVDVVLSYDFDAVEETIGFPPPGFVIETDRASFDLYVQYGLTDRVDLLAKVAYAEAEFSAIPTAPSTGELQDGLAGAIWRLREWRVGDGELSLSAFPSVKFPLDDYPTTSFLALGAGQVDYRAHLIAHYVPDGGRWYGSLDFGYDRRTRDPADELQAHLKLGRKLGPVWLTPFVGLTESREEAAAVGAVGATGTDVTRYGLEAFVPLGTDFGLIGRIRSTDDGRPSGAFTGYTVGVVYSR